MLVDVSSAGGKLSIRHEPTGVDSAVISYRKLMIEASIPYGKAAIADKISAAKGSAYRTRRPRSVAEVAYEGRRVNKSTTRLCPFAEMNPEMRDART